MKRISVVILITFLFPFWTSCVSDQAHRVYLEKQLPPKSPATVAILFEAPSRPYKVIADFQARMEFLANGSKYMQKKAAELGADAVICTPIGGKRNYSDEWASQDSSNTYSRMAGTAIIYTD